MISNALAGGAAVRAAGRALTTGKFLNPPFSNERGGLLEKDFSRLCSLAGADDAALFEDIDHPRGAGVAETQTALEQGGAGFLFLPNDFDAFHDEFFVGLGNIVFLVVALAIDGGLDFFFKLRLRLQGAVVDKALDLGIGDEGTLGPLQLGGAGR